MSDAAIELGDVRMVARLQEFFTRKTSLIEEIQAIVAARDEKVCDVLFPLLYAIVDSNKTISLLARNGAMRGTHVIARVSFETIVNACFILSSGDDAADRARQHAHQKAFRDLDRALDVSGRALRLMCSAKSQWESDPRVQAAVAAFTTKKGREITQWTPENVEERIKAVGTKHGPRAEGGLMFGLFAIYRHGSEIAHGSLFGALYSLGLTLPGGDESGNDLDRYIRMNLSTLLWFVGRSVNSLIYVIDREIGLTGFYERSEALMDAYQPSSFRA